MKSFLNIADFHLKYHSLQSSDFSSTFTGATNRTIALCYPQGEESPDSIGQCTGETPGDADEASTDSATENNCPLFFGRAGEDENAG